MSRWAPRHGTEVIAGGTTSLVKLRHSNTHVEKVPHKDPRDRTPFIRDLEREYLIYQRLPHHPRLLSLHDGSSSRCLVLPYLQNGSLHDYLRNVRRVPPPLQLLQIAADAAEAVHILHSCDVIHCDINSWNFLVDNEERLRIIDFAGSSVDGLPGSAFEGVRYCLPRSIDDMSTIQTDIFALGSVLYEISTGKQPYEDVDDAEVERLYRNGQYPSLENLLLSHVILHCWQRTYSSAHETLKDIQEILLKFRS